MKKKLPGLLLFVVLTFGLIYFSEIHQYKDVIKETQALPYYPSANKSGENPTARADYHTRMLLNPRTGRIPANIRQSEFIFSKTIPERELLIRNGRRLQVADWTSRGPVNVGGRTRALAFDFADSDHIIAGGVSGDVWNSTDGGQTWSLSSDPNSLNSITAIVQDNKPNRRNVWYYGTGELQGNSARAGGAPYRGDGIFKSIDNGESWFPLTATSTGNLAEFDNQYNYIWNVGLDPVDFSKNVVYAAIYGAIARSENAGDDWEIVLGPDHGFGQDINQFITPRFTDVAVASNGTVFATISALTNDPEQPSPDAGIFLSLDQGDNWQDITPGIAPGFGRIVVGVAPSDPNIIYFLVDYEDGYLLLRLTIDGATGTYEDVTSQIPDIGDPVGDFDTQGGYNMMLSINPEDPDVVLVGATNLYRTTDGFRSAARWIGGYSPVNDISKYPQHHPDQHVALFHPDNPDQVLSGHDGGLSFTSNIRQDSVRWSFRNRGYKTSQFYGFALDPAPGGDVIFGGMQDNGNYFTRNDEPDIDWLRVPLGGDGAYSAISSDGLFYYVSIQNAIIYRLTFDENFNNLTSFARVDPSGGGETEGQEYLFINPYILDPKNTNRMYLAGGDRIWRNVNLTQIPSGSTDETPINWEDLNNTQIDSGRVTALDASTLPLETDRVYFGSSIGQLFRIDDASTPIFTVQEITSPEFVPGGYINNITVDPANADRLTVVFSNYGIPSIYLSEDGGETFVDVSGNLEENQDGTGNGPSVRWVDIIPLLGGEYLYLAGTTTGLYSTSSLTANSDWAKEAPDVIGSSVVSMIRHRSSDGLIVASSHGSGMFNTRINDMLEIELEQEIPQQVTLGVPTPNPFTDFTTIPYSVPVTGITRISIVNMLGQTVKTLLWGTQSAGENVVTWDGTNDQGTPVAEGVYICTIEYSGGSKGTRVIHLN